jgi:succinate dehydrogenase flavin-adding protein (antitoxin of CptAB toxin-antitoxin module)
MTDREKTLERILNKFKEDPQFELKQEFGKFLMRHIDSLTVEERKRYDELLKILTTNE